MPCQSFDGRLRRSRISLRLPARPVLSRLVLLWFLLAAVRDPDDEPPPQCNPDAIPMQAPQIIVYESALDHPDDLPLPS